MISFVYFDVGGVVIDDFSGNNKWQRLKDELGITDRNGVLFERLWKQYALELNTGLDTESLLEIFKKELRLQLAPDYSLLGGFVDRFQANPTIWPIIEKVEKNAKVGLLTNMYPGMFVAIKRRNIMPPVNWDVVIDSSVELLQKPDKRFFKLAEKKANAKGGEILFVDNSPGHVNAARAFGWQTYLYDSADHAKAVRGLADFLQVHGLLG